MPHLFPDIDKSRVVFASAAEEQFYDVCRMGLEPAWRIYYSRTLSRMEAGEGMVDNEIDFVLYHPKWGVVVVEVRGGRIQFDAPKRQFYSINRHGESFAIKNPFQQALVWKARFLRVLQKLGIKTPVTHAVCLPSVNESEIPVAANVEPGIIIGLERIKNIEESLRELVQKSQPQRYLEFADVAQRLDSVLVGTTFTTRLHLKEYLRAHELRMKDIESIHDSLITPIASSVRLAIEGEAGTGKTMLATMLARHFRDLGKKVLLLSSNGMLNLLLKREAGPQVDVASYGEIAASFGIEFFKPPAEHEGSKDDWAQYVGPERLAKAISESTRRYDTLICDEAQDVQPFWWEALEKLLAGGEDSRFYLFFDRSQGVFGSGGADRHFVAEDVLPIKPPYFPLVHNYRMTREIATFSRPFRTGKAVLQSHCGLHPGDYHLRKRRRLSAPVGGLVQEVAARRGVGDRRPGRFVGQKPGRRRVGSAQDRGVGTFSVARDADRKVQNLERRLCPSRQDHPVDNLGFQGA